LFAQLCVILRLRGRQRDGLAENISRFVRRAVVCGYDTAQEPGVGKVGVQGEDSQAVFMCLLQRSSLERSLRGAVVRGNAAGAAPSRQSYR